jgi:hypothetical protein
MPDLGDQQRFERIIDIVIGSQRDQLDFEGNGRYERQLDLADLSGSVPPDSAEALMEGQQVRNVWAHNGGRGDAKLLQQAPNGGYEIGEKVTITKPMLGNYLLALNTYAMIIVNRYRVQRGFPPLVCYQGEQNQFKACFDELFPDATLPVSVEDMSRSAADTPAASRAPSP